MARGLVRLLALAWLGVVAVALGPTRMAAQITTGGITGTVQDADGKPVDGATIRIVNRATGFRTQTTTRANGQYFVTGLEIGRQYQVTAVAIGFKPESRVDVAVQLGITTKIDLRLERSVVELTEVTATTAPPNADIFSPTRTGTQTIVPDSFVARGPTLNRRIQDFARLTPQVTVDPANPERLIIAGQNNRLNAIQIDGSQFQDRFGLGATGELGGQAGGRGITLAAIKELQVLVSPFDIRQGNFTGGVLNAVTKNGTNKLAVDAFYYFRDQRGAQTDPFTKNSSFYLHQYGGSVGGPIIKDKLHFFFAAELQRAATPFAGLAFDANGTPSQPSVFRRVALDSFATILNERYPTLAAAQGYTDNASVLAAAGQFSQTNPQTNLVGRIDWQVSDRVRLVFRNVYNNSEITDFGRPTNALNNPLFSLFSNSFLRKETSNSFSVQSFATFKNGWQNETSITYLRQRFERVVPVQIPMVTIQNAGGASQGSIRFGAENSSQGNQLDQDLVEIRSDLNIQLGQRHTLTVGTRNEIYQVRNLFAQNIFGNWTFGNLTNFRNGVAQQFQVGASRGDDPNARFTSAIFGVYAQDRWDVTRNFSVIGGLRVDLPGFFDAPGFSPATAALTGRQTNQFPNWNAQISPRASFNWALPTGRYQTQVRGGIGLFNSQPIFVWLSNNFTNAGTPTSFAQLTCGTGNTPAFSGVNLTATPSPVCANGTGLIAGTPQVGVVNTVDPNLRFPQQFRISAAIDKELPWNVTATVEFLYNRGINNLFYTNELLAGPQGVDQNGRVLFGQFQTGNRDSISTGGVLNGQGNPVLRSLNFGGTPGGGILDVTNQSKDYSYNWAFSLNKRFRGGSFIQASYSYSRSWTVQDLTSSVAFSNWRNQRAFSGDQRDQTLGPSIFDQPHRIVISGTYTLPFSKKFPTDISFIYTGQSGRPVTFTAGGNAAQRGDLNGDGFVGNDPIYVPRDATNPAEMRFATATFNVNGVNTSFTGAQQAQAFEQFINANPCLAAQRGQIMGRGTCRNPWNNFLDVTFRQTLPPIAGNKLIFEVGIFNFLNLLNREWGKNYAWTGFPNQNIVTQVGALNTPAGAFANTQTPIFTFNPANVTPTQVFSGNDNIRADGTPLLIQATQFYQIQFAIRYAF